MPENPQTVDRDKLSDRLLSRYSIPENVLAQELNGEIILLNMNNETYYTFNPVGSLMWKLLIEEEADIQQLLQTYVVDSTTLLHDMAVLAEELLQEGLLQKVE